MFLAPVHIYDSGFSGTSMLLWQLTPEKYTFSFFLLILNIPFFLYGYRKQGFVFTVYSIFAIVIYSLSSYVIADVLPVNVVDSSPFAGTDLLLCSIFGGLISGIGSGLTIRFGGGNRRGRSSVGDFCKKNRVDCGNLCNDLQLPVVYYYRFYP